MACTCRLMALGAIRSDAAACLIEPHSVTSRKYLTAADSIMGKNPCNRLAWDVRSRTRQAMSSVRIIRPESSNFNAFIRILDLP
jgi:hypothetical protein